MANGSFRKTPRKPGTGFRHFFSQRFARLFCKRSIIIIADHKTQHVPISIGKQAFLCVAVLGIVAWAAYSGGTRMQIKREMAEKEEKLVNFAQENERVNAEFVLLKQDLVRLAESKGKAAQEAKELVEQYATSAAEASSAPTNAAEEVSAKYNAVFQRIQYLENKVKELQSTHDSVMADIRATTGGKIKALERIIAKTGVSGDALRRAAEAKRTQEEQRREKYGRIEGTDAGLNPAAIAGGQGGPFTPPPSSVLKEKETELYFDLRKLMTLNEVVRALPTGSPIATEEHRQTSGFGTRIDPFRGSYGFHSGVDLAGPSGVKVVASNKGRVDFTGWKTAYGNVVDVKHEYGFTTRYGHLRKILVHPGQVVKKGQVIGIQGSTGRSTGEHVHFEVQYNGKPINPGNFLKAGDDVRALD